MSAIYFEGSNTIDIKTLEINSLISDIKESVNKQTVKKTNYIEDAEIFSRKRNYINKLIKEDNISNFTREKIIIPLFQKEYNFNNVINSFNKQLYEQSLKQKELYKEQDLNLNLQNEVCYGESCYSYQVFMKALISAFLKYDIQGDAVLSTYSAKYLRDAIFLGAITLKDRRELYNLLQEGVNKESYVCGQNSEDEGERCQDILASLTILSEIWETENESKEVADLIYSVLNKYYKDKYGAIVLMDAIASLSFIDTDYSYSLIEEFLTQDTTPTTVGNRVREFLSVFSISGLYEGLSEQVSNFFIEGGHYLNRRNVMWQYINETATEKENVNLSSFDQPLNRLDKDFDKTYYHIVFGNVLTDIGEFLSNQEGRGQELSKKIIKRYIEADKEEIKNIHIPLVLGLIQNSDSPDCAVASQRLQSSFYYDLNGGTGKWVQNKAKVNGKYNFNFPLNVRDEEAYLSFTKKHRITVFGDFLVIAGSLIYIAKKLPQIVSDIKHLVSIIKLRRTSNYNSVIVSNSASRAVAKQAQSNTLVPNTVANTQPSFVTALSMYTNKTPLVVSPNADPVLTKIRKTSAEHKENNNGQLSFDFPPKVNNTTTTKPIKISDINILGKSVFKLEGPDNQFSGFLAEIPIFGVNRQVIITAGHGVDRYPKEPVAVFDYLGNQISTALVLFYALNYNAYKEGDIRGLFEDFALLLPETKIDATPIDLNFQGIYPFRIVETLSFPKGQFSHGFRQPTNVMGENTFRQVSYENIEFLSGTSKPGSSGGVVLAKTTRDKFSALGTIVASHDNGITYVHNFNWVKDFLQGKMKLPSIADPLININFPTKELQLEIPFDLANNFDKTLLHKTSLQIEKKENINVLKNITKAELVPAGSTRVNRHAVWVLKDSKGNIVAYLKYGTEEEIRRTKLFHQIITENNLLEKYPLINFEYPKIIEEDISSLPEKIQIRIKMELLKIKDFLWGHGKRGKVPFIMTAINTEGFSYYDISELSKREISELLGGQGVSEEELKQTRELLGNINDRGFIHEDFFNNFFMMRNKTGKLTSSMLDFEVAPNGGQYNNIYDFNYFEQMFKKLGLVNNVDKTISKP